MPLLDRHLRFVEALREVGLAVSLSEALDSVRVVEALGLGDRGGLRDGLAAALVKRELHRPHFDALFDLYYPALLGSGVAANLAADNERDLDQHTAGPGDPDGDDLRNAIVAALAADSDEGAQQQTLALARQAVQRYGEMAGRGRGLSRWSSYNTMREVNADALVLRLARALAQPQTDRSPRSEESAIRTASTRVERWTQSVEADVRRRIAEDKGPEHVARTTLRPSLEQLSFLNASRDEVEQMRREILPLARRLATRLTKEQHARRRGPLDFRRTVRASISTGGVPIITHHKPRRPHRTELVVLCDVSGSVANFASFTLMLVYALREQFGAVRAFTFVDEIHEVSDQFVVGDDPAATMLRLTESARHASRFGRTDYGRALRRFNELQPHALTAKSTLLILGDARSNFTDPALDVLAELVEKSRYAFWLNPEGRSQWSTGDSAASSFAQFVTMTECRNLTQLSEFVHDLL